MGTHTSLVTIAGYYTLTLSGNNTYDLKTWLHFFRFCCGFLHCRVMWMYVHMSARSCHRSSFVYLFLACSWFFLFNWCVFVWVCEWGHQCGHSRVHAGFCFLSRCHILVQSVTEDVLLNLDSHISVVWPGYFRISDSGICHFWVEYTTVYIDETWYVWIWPLFAQVMVVFRGKLHFPWVRAETTDDQMRRGHSALYQLFDWWIMDEVIDCLAQLCSTDPLWIQFKSD